MLRYYCIFFLYLLVIQAVVADNSTTTQEIPSTGSSTTSGFTTTSGSTTTTTIAPTSAPRVVPEGCKVRVELTRLNFQDGELTSEHGRDVRPQSTCHGEFCSNQARPRLITCQNLGLDDNDKITWDCNAYIDNRLQIVYDRIHCEGCQGSDDREMIITGSCSMDYTLYESGSSTSDDFEYDDEWRDSNSTPNSNPGGVNFNPGSGPIANANASSNSSSIADSSANANSGIGAAGWSIIFILIICVCVGMIICVATGHKDWAMMTGGVLCMMLMALGGGRGGRSSSSSAASSSSSSSNSNSNANSMASQNMQGVTVNVGGGGERSRRSDHMSGLRSASSGGRGGLAGMNFV